MRQVAWALLLVLAFAIPWEHSLDFGEPFGDVARLAVIALLAALVPAILKEGSLRTPGALQIASLALLAWFCLASFWTIDLAETARELRAYAQEIIIVWLVWELVERPADLRWMLRALVAGAGVLAVLTILNFLSASSPEQVRFKAEGQDPNDVARLLVLAFPVAALLVASERKWPGRLLSAAYLSLGVLGVLLTASRAGLISAAIALFGCAVLLALGNGRRLMFGMCAAPVLVAAAWIVVPSQTIARLATMPHELLRGDFNQRWDIWLAGWQAFARAPFIGYGPGAFVAAAGVAPIDTAHNTILALLVEGGVVALLIAAAIMALSVALVLQLRGPLRIAFGTALLTWSIDSLVGTVQENRATWLLLGLIATAARLDSEDPYGLQRMFTGRPLPHLLPVPLAEPSTPELS